MVGIWYAWIQPNRWVVKMKDEIEKLNHELRNAVLTLEGILKRLNKAIKDYEAGLEDDVHKS